MYKKKQEMNHTQLKFYYLEATMSHLGDLAVA